MRWIVKLTLLALLIWQLPKLCHRATDGFSLINIASNLSYDPQWEVEGEAKEPLETIVNQRFSYLSAGGQSYVFASEDGQYVLKFFKHYRMRLHPFIRVLPLPHTLHQKRVKQQAKRLKKLVRDFTSYKLAFEQLPKETKLLFVHLNKGNNLKLKTTIVDRLNIAHPIDLDSHEFVLQRRAELAYPYIKRLVESGEIDKAKRAVESICQLITSRCEKGIYDEDAKIHRNVGFIDEEAILIDVGRLKIDPRRKNREVQKGDLKKITEPMVDFLEDLSPELSHHLRRIRKV